jgi:serine/threonine protein phosphatase 1
MDLVEELLAAIEADDTMRPTAHTVVVFLGDYIDRGPSSAALVDRLMAGLPWATLVCLKGNHEAAMIDAFGGDQAAARMWLAHGGVQALESWGVAADLLQGDIEGIIETARATVPEPHRRWISRLPISYWVGDYYFVHAGVRPGVPLDRQSSADQLWIRQDFLRSRTDHGACVVHGHSISDDVEIRPNRIGIDTGAYASGRLSAIGLEGVDRWILDTAPLP